MRGSLANCRDIAIFTIPSFCCRRRRTLFSSEVMLKIEHGINTVHWGAQLRRAQNSLTLMVWMLFSFPQLVSTSISDLYQPSFSHSSTFSRKTIDDRWWWPALSFMTTPCQTTHQLPGGRWILTMVYQVYDAIRTDPVRVCEEKWFHRFMLQNHWGSNQSSYRPLLPLYFPLARVGNGTWSRHPWLDVMVCMVVTHSKPCAFRSWGDWTSWFLVPNISTFWKSAVGRYSRS